MTDRPIIFSVPMIHGLLEGRKWQTRRLLRTPSPRIEPGDRLWVRENFWQASRYPGSHASGGDEPASACWGSLWQFESDGTPANTPNRHYPDGLRGGAISAPDPYAVWLKRPSIHMPREKSRLTLFVTDVRTERLQDISDADAKAEGVTRFVPASGPAFWEVPGVTHPNKDFPCLTRPTAWEMFAAFWDVVHHPGAWAENPLVCAISFRVHRINIDKLDQREAA